jgi:glycosyltransferase involved in cell wall biosynthesis
MKNHHFKIIVCCYNVEKWITANIKSIKKQTHENFHCIIVDAVSSDKTVEKARELIKGDARFEVVCNEKRKFALQNIYEMAHYSKPDDEDIITTVDGDDWLADETALEKVNKCYNENEEIVLTYGNYIFYPEGSQSELRAYPEDIIENADYRKYKWLASHLRTYKYKLFKNIKKDDLIASWNEKFYDMAYDMPLMYPMLEMSAGKWKFMSDILYTYNVVNPLNENKVDIPAIYRVENEVRNKKKYEPLF